MFSWLDIISFYFFIWIIITHGTLQGVWIISYSLRGIKYYSSSWLNCRQIPLILLGLFVYSFRVGLFGLILSSKDMALILDCDFTPKLWFFHMLNCVSEMFIKTFSHSSEARQNPNITQCYMTFGISVKDLALQKPSSARSYIAPLCVCTAHPWASDIKGTLWYPLLHSVLHSFLLSSMLTITFLPLQQLWTSHSNEHLSSMRPLLYQYQEILHVSLFSRIIPILAVFHSLRSVVLHTWPSVIVIYRGRISWASYSTMVKIEIDTQH